MLTRATKHGADFLCKVSLCGGTAFRLQVSKTPRSRNAYFLLTKEKNPIAIHIILAKGKVVDTVPLTKNSSLRFLSNTRQEINVGMKERKIDFVRKQNEDNWIFQRSVTTRDYHKSFKLSTNSF